MSEDKEKLIIAKTKLEVYKEVKKNIEKILNGDDDILYDYEIELYSIIQNLSGEISEMESEPLRKVSYFVKKYPQWEEISESEKAIIKSIIEIEKIEPVSTSNSLHVYEEQYIVDGDTFRFTSAISSPKGECDIQKLKK